MPNRDTLIGVDVLRVRIPAVEPGRRRRSVLMTWSAERHVKVGACGNLSHADHYKFRHT